MGVIVEVLVGDASADQAKRLRDEIVASVSGLGFHPTIDSDFAAPADVATALRDVPQGRATIRVSQG